MTSDGGNKGEQPRAPDGQFVKTEEALQKEAEACRLRGQGWGYQQIADRLYNGDIGNAHRGVKNARRAILSEPATELRQAEKEHLHDLRRMAYEVAKRSHQVVQHGKIVRDENGAPVLDDAPLLAAVDRLVKVAERLAKLEGLDAPAQAEVSAVVRYELPGVDTEKLR